jgi:hypothetical protein
VKRLLIAGSLIGLQAACTSAQWYEAGKQWQAQECRKLPLSEQERCLARHSMSFEQYQREREAASKPKARAD